MKNPYKLGDVIRATRGCGHGVYRAGAVGTVCAWNGVHPSENDEAVWVDFNHPDNPFPALHDGIWSVNVDECEVVSSKFTVLLLRPDYMADSFGSDTYLTNVDAAGPEEALRLAREAVIKCDHEDVAEFHKYHDPTDYACLLLIAGDHKDLNPEM